MPQDAFHRSELRDSDAFYVLALTVASRTLYVSTAADVAAADSGQRAGFIVGGIVRDDGTTLAVVDGLDEVDWTDTMALGQTSPPVTSVPLRVVLPDVDWAEMESDGYDISAATGELSLWLRGQTWEKRRVLVRGQPHQPQYGAKGEPLEFTLKAAPFEDRSLYPPASAVVDATTWPSADTPAVGRYYPTIIGYPGRLDGGSAQSDGSPGLIVDTSNRYLLIAGHEVEASAVDVRDVTDGSTWRNISVDHREDGRGRKVATVTLPTTGAATYVAGNEYHVSWGNGTDGGGLYNRRRTAPMRSAGEVLEHFLALSTLKVDRGRTAAAVDLLRGFKLDGYWDEPASVWEWLQANVTPILPVSIQAGPDGLYPVVWEVDIRDPATVDVINADRGDGYRVGPIRRASTLFGELANEFRVEFGLDSDTGAYRRQHVVHGDPDALATAEFVPSVACRRSRSRYGLDAPAVQRISSDLIVDRSTAAAVAAWRVLLHAFPVRRVSYVVRREYGHLRVGAAVALTDAEVHLSSAHALVEEMSDSGEGQILLRLAILEGRLDA